MGYNCKLTESILAILIIIFAFWQTAASIWIIVIAAVLLLIHSHKCGGCSTCATCGNEKMPKKKSSRKKRK